MNFRWWNSQLSSFVLIFTLLDLTITNDLQLYPVFKFARPRIWPTSSTHQVLQGHPKDDKRGSSIEGKEKERGERPTSHLFYFSCFSHGSQSVQLFCPGVLVPQKAVANVLRSFDDSLRKAAGFYRMFQVEGVPLILCFDGVRCVDFCLFRAGICRSLSRFFISRTLALASEMLILSRHICHFLKFAGVQTSN